MADYGHGDSCGQRGDSGRCEAKPSGDLSLPRVNFDELFRLYELLDEYGRTLTDPTNRPIDVLVFEAFHRWEVRRIASRHEVAWPDELNFAMQDTRWVWLETGGRMTCPGGDGLPREDFGLDGCEEREGTFVVQPALLPIPAYVESLDDALDIKGRLSRAKLQIIEPDGNLFPLWKAVLTVGDAAVHEDEAAAPSVAVLKAVLKQLLGSPEQLNWPKFGPPTESP